MPMSISQSAQPASQAPAGTGASVKAEGGKAFDQTLVQTLSGSAGGKQANGQPAQQAGAAEKNVPVEALKSLLGDNVTSAQLLDAIKQLQQKLDSIKQQDDAEPATVKKLSDALTQMDDLLSLLGFPHLPQQPVPDQAAPTDGPDPGTAPDQLSINGEAGGIVAILNAIADQQVAVQPTAQSEASATLSGAVSNLSPVTTLKFELQDSFTELMSFIKDNKSTAAGRNAFAAISKQLAAVDDLLTGGRPSGAPAQFVEAVQANAAESIGVLQTIPAANAHLQKMGRQLLHAGILAVVPAKEGADETSELPKTSAADPMPAFPLVSGLQEQQKLAVIPKAAIQQPVPVQQFAQTMQGLIVKQFNVSAVNGAHEARISLLPEQLGQVDVRISLHNGQLTAQFVTDTASAKDALENQLAQLRAALQSQGLNVDKLEVSQSQIQPNLFQERQGQQGRDQQTAKRNKSKDEAGLEIAGFDADLEQIETEQAVHRDLGLGRGIHTTA